MQWEFIVALALGIPVVLFPVVLVWYLNIGGIYAAIQRAWQKKAIREERSRVMGEEHLAETQPAGTKR